MRTTPYTQKGIRRVPCARCGASSEYQWNICSDHNQYRGLCLACDIALNALVLGFMEHALPPAVARLLLENYKKSKGVA